MERRKREEKERRKKCGEERNKTRREGRKKRRIDERKRVEKWKVENTKINLNIKNGTKQI